MQNPFTTTFSKAPEYTYIATEKTEEILDNFSYDNPTESVYKITGVRGSGKTVILAKIEDQLRKQESEAEGWLVFDVTPVRNLLVQIAAMLEKNGFTSKNKINSISVSANILGTGGSLGFSKSSAKDYFDIGVELEDLLIQAQQAGKKILIGIDEVSKSSEMIEFASEYGKWLRAGYPVYLVCTGLYENIQELSNVKNLTFFRRATTVKTEPLNTIRMAEMYKDKLDVNSDEAKEMALLTKGYAYAFQELGVLTFKKHNYDTKEDIINSLKTELFVSSYEKIWEEMTEMDRFLVRLLTEKEEYKRDEVLTLMGDKASNYSMYRDRLIKRGILNSRQGYISLALPFFADYIKEYGM